MKTTISAASVICLTGCLIVSVSAQGQAGCPDVIDISCLTGRIRDQNGCPTNECDCSSPCQIADCLLRPPGFQYSCPTTNRLDACNCVLNCQCAGCPNFNLNLECPFGKVNDARGCPTNVCACPRPDQCLPLPPLAPPFAYTCPSGYAVDSCGCRESGYQCAGCPAVLTTVECQSGRRLDVNRCPTNSCNEDNVVKPGSCPRFGSFGSTKCGSDADCPGRRKCCKSRSRRGITMDVCTRVSNVRHW